jgi:DNA polymerase mu
LRIHVVPTKLDGQLPALYEQIEALGGTVSPLETCSFAITALKGRPRLEKVLGERWLDEKQILGIDFVKDAFNTCLKYGSTAMSSSSIQVIGSITPTLPPRSKYLVANTGSSSFDESAVDRVLEGDYPPDLEPPDEDVPLESISKSAVERCSPLVCPNQDVVSCVGGAGKPRAAPSC